MYQNRHNYSGTSVRSFITILFNRISRNEDEKQAKPKKFSVTKTIHKPAVLVCFSPKEGTYKAPETSTVT